MWTVITYRSTSVSLWTRVHWMLSSLGRVVSFSECIGSTGGWCQKWYDIEKTWRRALLLCMWRSRPLLLSPILSLWQPSRCGKISSPRLRFLHSLAPIPNRLISIQNPERAAKYDGCQCWRHQRWRKRSQDSGSWHPRCWWRRWRRWSLLRWCSGRSVRPSGRQSRICRFWPWPNHSFPFFICYSSFGMRRRCEFRASEVVKDFLGRWVRSGRHREQWHWGLIGGGITVIEVRW